MIQNKDTHNVQEEKIIIDPIKKKALNLIQRLYIYISVWIISMEFHLLCPDGVRLQMEYSDIHPLSWQPFRYQ